MRERWSVMAAAAAVLLAGAACQRQEGGRQASGEQRQQRESAGSAEQRPGQQGGSSTAQQGTQAQASAQQRSPTTGQQMVSGEIVRASPDEIVLRQGTGQPELRLKVGPDTTVTMGGQQRSLADLREGTQVRASFDASAGEPKATKIEAMSGRGR